jgi:capsular polysaccharide biosynthesis protein
VREENLLVEREVTLLGLTLLAVRRWKMLVAVGIAAAILSGLVLSVTPASYQATAKILVKRTSSSEDSYGIDRTVVEPDYFAATLESDAVLQRIIEMGGLHQEPYKFSPERFRGAVDISPVRNENSLLIQVRLPAIDENAPEKTAEVANLFVEEASRLAEDLLTQDIRRSLALFDEQYRVAESNLESVRDSYREAFVEAPVEGKTKEIENLALYQRVLQNSLALAQSELETKSPKLPVLEGMLQGEDRTLIVSRSLAEDAGLLLVTEAATQSSSRELFTATAYTEVINDVYTNLRNLRDTTQADVKGLSQAVEQLRTDISSINSQIEAAERVRNASQEEVEYWADRLETAQLTFRAVDERHKVAGMAIAADRQDMISQYPAIAPIKPSGVPRVLLVAMAPIIAMIIFLALLFVIEIIRVSIRPNSQAT